MGLLHGADDGVHVQGSDTSQIDHFHLDAVFFGEVFRGVHAESDGAGVGDEGEVRAGALDVGLAQGEGEVGAEGRVGHGEGDAVHEFVFEDDAGVGVPDAALGRRESIGKRRGVCGCGLFLVRTFNKPLASSADQGLTTFNPGTEPYQAAKH